MQVVYGERVQQDPEFFRLAQRATKMLGGIVNSTKHPAVQTKWDLVLKHPPAGTAGRDIPFLSLQLTDGGETVTDAFAPHEIENSTWLAIRLHRTWGNLLQIRSHKQLQQLQEAIGAQEGS